MWELAASELEGNRVAIKDAATPGALAQALDPAVKQTPALELIDRKLVAMFNGAGPKRLIISISPQEGKSQRASRAFPLWALIRNPDIQLAVASYEARTAIRWGRAVRNDIKGHPELGLRVRDDTSAANEWVLDRSDGGMYSVGIGGALTSRRVDGLIIDDPVKDRHQADSLAYRNTVWDWWTDVAKTRFSIAAWVVLIQTRWHTDDLAGRLIDRESNTWDVLNIPALADHRPEKGETDPLGREPGEWMQSARGNRIPDWEDIRRTSPRTFGSLYQGRPAPAEGALLKRQFWRLYDTPRAVRRDDGTMWAAGADEIIQSWDMAFKDTKASDFVCGQVWGRWGTDVYLLDQVHARLGFVATVDAVRRLTAEWPQAAGKVVEEKANGAAVIDYLRREIPGFIPVNPRDGKYARAVAVLPYVEGGNVWLPAAASYTEGLIEECAVFPNSANDDRVDTLTQAVDRLLGHPVAKAQILGRPAVALPSGIGGALGGSRPGARFG